MSTVPTTDVNSVLGNYGPQTSVKKKDETEDRFLTLLVTQLKNQDPLNPLDNAQVTTQLAQINTVKGIEQLNTTLSALTGRVNNSESLAALSAVGRMALVPGAQLTLYDGRAAAGFTIPQDVDGVTVRVLDGAGNVLHRADLGAQDAGVHTFVWDGMTDSGAAAANGTYRYEIEARVGQNKIEVEALALGRIDGVLPDQEQLTFNMGGLPPVKLSEVRQFL